MIAWLPPLLASPFAGSVAGVLIRRLPAGQSVVWSRSACESCGRALGPVELVPIGSFLWLRGRCGTCRQPIARFHLAVELAALAVAALVLASGTPSPWADCGLGWTLLALAWIDARHFFLPDVLTLPLLVAGLCVTWIGAPQTLAAHALGAIVGYCGFRTIELVYHRLRGRPGLGEGDAKLLAAAGAWTGVVSLPGIVFCAALLGIVMTLGLRLNDRRRLAAPVPFGPPLALAFLLARLFPATFALGAFSPMFG